MLNFLRISGFALIDEIELSLSPGFTVITGETGAGKSILVDALGLLRGGRARTEVIRNGQNEAQVEALWSLDPDSEVVTNLKEQGRNTEDPLVVRRLVNRSGRGRTYLAGGLATVGELQNSVGRLIDITSQHDQQSLMDPESQLAIVDVYAENGPRVEKMRAAYAGLSAARQALAAFDADATTRAEREDFLRYQLAELQEAALMPGEDVSLKQERDKMKSAGAFLAIANRGQNALYADDDAAATRVTQVARELETLARLDPEFGAMAERLLEAGALIEDVARGLSRYGGDVQMDPRRLEEIEERLYLIGRLVRKHGGSVETAIAAQGDLESQLAELAAFDDSLQTHQKAVQQAEDEAIRCAQALSQRRVKVAKALGKEIDATLADLGLKGAQIRVDIETRTGPDPVGPQGSDKVVFQFSPNVGEPPRPLARIASGGELSRVMLAVKRALAAADNACTYVFDEVDTGVGGAVAEVIGRKIKAISMQRQVIAITHLPQIACFADQHLLVKKVTRKGRTFAEIKTLDPAERQEEIARMLGGQNLTAQARAHAQEMLAGAAAAG